MELSIYKVDYVYYCSWNKSNSNDHEIAYVEAPKRINRRDMEKLLDRKVGGFFKLNSFTPIDVVKFTS